MEGDPFAIVEAMTIAAFATGCARGYIYIRGEYPLASERTAARDRRGAPTAARHGHPGAIAFDIEIRRGAGAYICGEETAIFESIEGKRGEPRNKPPFPVQRRAVRQADGRQQRRDARQHPAHRARRRRGVRGRRHARSRPARGCSACAAACSSPASTRRRSAPRCGASSRWPAAFAAGGAAGRAARRRGRHVRAARRARL